MPVLASGAVLLGFLVLAALLLVLRDRIDQLVWRFRNPPAKLRADQERYERRLRSPDWVFYERHLQRSAPQELRAAFARDDVVMAHHHFASYYVTFSPIDEQALSDAWVLPGVVAFADSDGDPIFLKPGISVANEVFIAYHDGGGMDKLASSVGEFLAGLRSI